MSYVFFFNDTATTEIYTLSLHDALPIWSISQAFDEREFVPELGRHRVGQASRIALLRPLPGEALQGLLRREAWLRDLRRSEEHTSELQSRQYLVCRLLLEKKK